MNEAQEPLAQTKEHAEPYSSCSLGTVAHSERSDRKNNVPHA